MTMADPHNTNLTFEGMLGEVSISERGQKKNEPPGKGDYTRLEPGMEKAEAYSYEMYSSTSLVSAEVADMTIRIGTDSDIKTVIINLAVHHLADDETERVFHADIEGHLNQKQVRKLHAYLSFVLVFLEDKG